MKAAEIGYFKAFISDLFQRLEDARFPIQNILAPLLISLSLLTGSNANASDEIRIIQVTDYQEDQMLLFDSQTQFHLPDAILEALQNEIVITFETNIVFTEHHRLLGIKYDRERFNLSYQTQLIYSGFNNRYTLINERNNNVRHFSSLSQALSTLGTMVSFPVLPLSELHPGQKHTLKLRIRLNPWRLPAPLVLNSFIDSDWKLDSGWFETTIYTPKSWL
ncbi:DUF4390 domain-containing protein [Thiomicrorhabdus sp.]|uniref:DUF4390 domain-containing protein n=1 Tax=Thiomicrorhabdus sp. TaxID=2039724 RepID=UPI003562146B